jgi:hypothetical protein
VFVCAFQTPLSFLAFDADCTRCEFSSNIGSLPRHTHQVGVFIVGAVPGLVGGNLVFQLIASNTHFTNNTSNGVRIAVMVCVCSFVCRHAHTIPVAPAFGLACFSLVLICTIHIYLNFVAFDYPISLPFTSISPRHTLMHHKIVSLSITYRSCARWRRAPSPSTCLALCFAC